MTGPLDVGDELGPGEAGAVPADLLADAERGEVVGIDLEALPEAGAVQEVNRRIDAAKAVAIGRGGRPCSRGTETNLSGRTTGLNLIFAESGQSRSSLERVTGARPLADKPARIFDNAWTVPMCPRCRLTIDPGRTCPSVLETTRSDPGSR